MAGDGRCHGSFSAALLLISFSTAPGAACPPTTLTTPNSPRPSVFSSHILRASASHCLQTHYWRPAIQETSGSPAVHAPTYSLALPNPPTRQHTSAALLECAFRDPGGPRVESAPWITTLPFRELPATTRRRRAHPPTRDRPRKLTESCPVSRSASFLVPTRTSSRLLKPPKSRLRSEQLSKALDGIV